jgi:hypothetical protein
MASWWKPRWRIAPGAHVPPDACLIRGARGLGDALLVYPVAAHYLGRGKRVVVSTAYPEVFEPLDCDTIPFSRRIGVTVDCSYASRKKHAGSSLWEDTLHNAGIDERIPFAIDYVDRSRLELPWDRRICLIENPRRTTIAGWRMTPRLEVYEDIVRRFRREFFFVLVGRSSEIRQRVRGVDLDLVDRTSLHDLFRLVDRAEISVTQAGHLMHFAEGLQTRVLILLTRRATRSWKSMISTITPRKLACTPYSACLCEDADYLGALAALLAREVPPKRPRAGIGPAQARHRAGQAPTEAGAREARLAV